MTSSGNHPGNLEPEKAQPNFRYDLPRGNTDCKGEALSAPAADGTESGSVCFCDCGGADGRSSLITELPGRFPGAETYSRRSAKNPVRIPESAPRGRLPSAID